MTTYMYYKALRPPQTTQHGIVTMRTHKHQPEAKRQVQR